VSVSFSYLVLNERSGLFEPWFLNFNSNESIRHVCNFNNDVFAGYEYGVLEVYEQNVLKLRIALIE
jgi:hypothetical protein